MKKTFGYAFALAALLLSTQAFAVGETMGHIAGYVFDPTGSPLSDVPVSVHSTKLMEPQTRVSDAQGHFEFPLLPPGEDYYLEVDVPGFTPVRKKGIEVALGQTTPIDVHLAVMTEATSQATTFEIVEKVNPALNPDSAQSGAVVTHEKAEITPVFHQVQAMPAQVAGVGPGSSPSTLGGFGRFGRYYVDGMDATDITDGSFNAPMNFDVVENFEIITGGFDAQYNAMGLVQNLVTKNGGDNFTYDANLTWTAPALNASTKVFTGQPSFNMAENYYTGPSPLTSFFSPVFNLGGPIVKGKLWFEISGQINRSIKQVLVSNFYENDDRTTTTWTDLGRIKLTWQISSSDMLSAGLNLDMNRIYNNSNGSPSVAPSGEGKTNRGGYFLSVNYNHNFSDNVLFQLQTGITSKRVDFDPEVDGINHRDTLSGVTQFSSGSFTHEVKSRFEFDPMLSVNASPHQIKGGIQTSFMLDTQLNGVPGAVKFTDKGGVCDPTNPNTFAYCSQRTDFYNTAGDAAPLQTTANAYNIGLFLQDRWSVSRQLTVIPGVRVDTGLLYGQQGFATQLTGIGPRLSATYDLHGDRKKLITAHYGRSNDVGNVGIPQFSNPSLTSVTSTFVSGAFAACYINSPSPNCSTFGSAGRLMSQNPTPPHLDEVSVGYRQEAFPTTVIGIDAAYRKYANLWANQEVNRIFDFTGTKIIGYVNGVPTSILQATKPDSAYREYAGTSLWIQGNPTHWDLLASYTLGFTRGTVDDYFTNYLTDPRFNQYYEGYVSDDHRHTLKGSIAYSTDIGLDFGVKFSYITGSPLWESFSGNPADSALPWYRSPRGTGFALNGSKFQDTNDPTSWTDLRNPDVFSMDLQARWNVGKVLNLGQNKVELAVFAFNVLNNVGATSLTSTQSAKFSSFGLISSRNSPLQIELFLRVRNF